MSDNVDVYRKLFFRPPPVRVMAGVTVALGLIFGAGSVFALSPFTGLRINLAGAALAAVFFYIIPALLSAEVIGRVGGVSRKWTYLMAVSDQVILFFFSLTVLFTDSVSEAWQVLWLGLATAYLLNFLMVLMARGRDSLHANLLYALVFPGTVLVTFHVFIGRLIGIPSILYLENSVFFLVSAFLLLLTAGFYTFIARANVDMSVLEFFPPIILGENQALPGGIRTDVHHQSLEVDNGESLTFNVPWLHPGPVEGFGGGRLTSELIDIETFMLHVPSYHTLDLADPADIDLFRETPGAGMQGKASRLLRMEKDGFTLYGRKYAGGKVVYVQNRFIDDYEPSIAYGLKEEHPALCLVDLHNQQVGRQPWLQHMESDARLLEDAVGEMVERLEDAEMHDYRAGFGGDTAHRCLVEEVDGQLTVLLGVDASDAPPVLHEVENDLDFDHALVFTTDSHGNLVDMASPPYSREELEESVEEAMEEVSDAEAGIGERKVEDVRVLGKDYEGLISTLNVMGRLIPITLVLYYIAIVFLIL